MNLNNNVKTKSYIKIYEMLLRDGLQSLSKNYTLVERLSMYKLIESIGLTNIEFGSMTSEKILPQMSKSLELYNNIINQQTNQTNLIMLCPSIKGLEKSIESGIKNISLLCSTSNNFSYKNLNCDKTISTTNMLNQLELIIKKDFELIRIYVSCSFGSPWDNFDSEYLNNLINLVKQIYDFAIRNQITHEKFDIVLSDTFGLGTEENISKLYLNLNNIFGSKIFDYLALHLHTCQIEMKENYNNDVIQYNKSIGFEKLILISLENNIYKYDSSILGLGGCPFGEDNLKGNLSTLDLINFLESIGFECNIDKKKLIDNSFLISKIINS
jgi:hydroxymethylglutaryl-CoA lyase